MTRSATRAPARGTTLIEALVALVVTAFGALAAVHLQAEIRRQADLVRQRAEAVRLAAGELERLRGFARLAAASGVPAYADIAGATRTVDAASGALVHSETTLRTVVAPLAAGDAQAVGVDAAWNDPRHGPASVQLATVVAAHDPALGASLLLGSGDGTPAGAHGRAHVVPVDAIDLGDGTSAWKPSPDSIVALRFANDAPGGAGTVPIGVCAGIAPGTPTAALTAARLSTCAPTAAATSLLRGTVRFSDAAPADPRRADVPLPTGVRLVLLGAGHLGAPECWTERVAAGSDPHVAYACLVVPRADGRWSARAELVPVGWTVGTGPADRRVCRFAHDRDGSGAIDAPGEHPRDWVGVHGPLVHQNFVVVRGGEPCPAGSGIADPWHTEAHQP